jgi:hypothetical protein
MVKYEVEGAYFDDLKRLGLPNYVFLNDRLFIVKYMIWKSTGRGINKQRFYVLTDGRIKHPDQVKRLDNKQILSLQRDLILKEILNDKSE